MLQATELDLDPKQFQALCELVQRHCGIRLHDGKQELVRARLSRLMRLEGNGNPADYLDRVMADPDTEDFRRLIDVLSTNLTSFFRESSHFTFVREKLLPALVEKHRKQRRQSLRVWSAACSTGEEPYSLAMTLADALDESWDIKILATDISRDVLRKASAGRYESARVQQVPPSLREKYLVREGSDWCVSAEIRSMVKFNYLNLMEPWPFRGPFDFIFCRNVMIYFDKATQQRLVGRFHDCLDRGGYLFTGHSESLTGIAHKFSYSQPTIYQKA